MRIWLVAGLMVAMLSGAAEARGRRSYGPRHTVSHGGRYFGGSGSSHRGGRYFSPATGNKYRRHK